jgi:RimJ/RimL family protein N-acetyltransferase
MNTKEVPTIKTERLVLRPFAMSDGSDILEYTNDPEWVRYLVNIPHPFTRKDAEAFVRRFSDLKSWETLPMFAIIFKEKVIGEIYLNDLNLQHERGELGYDLSRAYWGKGLATEASRAVLDWAFQTYNLNRIYATCDPRNNRSHRVLEKLGMTREGILRSHLKWNGERRDQVYYGILRDEWLRRG